MTNSIELIKHSPERKKDVQQLCDAVLEIGADHWDNPNGPYEGSP